MDFEGLIPLEPPTKRQKLIHVNDDNDNGNVNMNTSEIIVEENTAFSLSQKLLSIVPDSDLSKEFLVDYGTYFHNQITLGTVLFQDVLNPTKDIHYFCRVMGYLLTLPYKQPDKVRIFLNFFLFILLLCYL